MTGNVTASLHIVGLTDRGVQCVTLTSTAAPFWLPRGTKDGKKFLSLAATPAEEKNGSAARRPAPVDDDSKTSCGTKRARELDDLEFSGATYD
jgi:hypothetical protein